MIYIYGNTTYIAVHKGCHKGEQWPHPNQLQQLHAILQQKKEHYRAFHECAFAKFPMFSQVVSLPFTPAVFCYNRVNLDECTVRKFACTSNHCMPSAQLDIPLINHQMGM